MEIMVSVCCTVFNHAPYLRKTLDGFVNQKTSFPFEVVIHDDASTDGSADIIREYCEKYPDLFVPILQTENQYSKKVPITRTIVFPLMRGKYVAMCEGDDYWCDENKLQLQVDYMEAHPDCSMCVHDTAYINSEGQYLGSCVSGLRKDKDYNLRQIIKADGGNLCQTSSFLARHHVLTQRPDSLNIPRVGDIPNLLHAGLCGYIHYIGRVMSCYRTGVAGSWTARTSKNKDSIIQQKTAEYEAFTRISLELDPQYKSAFRLPRGLRLSILYRKGYGLGKLLLKPTHLGLVLWTHMHTFPRKLRKKLRTFRNRKERISL